jgi:hypothetical protein
VLAHHAIICAVRALAARPSFHAGNIAAVVAGREAPTALEADTAVFDRYVASLPAALQPTAETFRPKAVGRRLLHRAKLADTAHDPVHSLFLVPGVGLNPGLPGNYLYGSIIEDDAADPHCTWSLHVHDRDDGAASCDGLPRDAAWAKFEELLASAPFMLSELDALDFRLNFEPPPPPDARITGHSRGPLDQPLFTKFHPSHGKKRYSSPSLPFS